MGTPFENIFRRAIFKFKDFDFLDFTIEIKSEIMYQHLLSAIVDFTRASVIPLTYSVIEEEDDGDTDIPTRGRRRHRRTDEPPEEEEAIEQFAFDHVLGLEEQEILALGLAFHWLSGKVLNSELLKNVMHNRDYKSYSPANLLKAMQSLRENIKTEFKGRINTYSFRNSNIQSMRTFRG